MSQKQTFDINKLYPPLEFTITHKDVCLPSIRELMNPKYGYIIDSEIYLNRYNTTLQRGLVWKIDEKAELILSILKDMPISQLAVINHLREDGKRVIKIIDGKQRINAIIDFADNKFPITHNDIDYYFDNLCQKDQCKILSFMPHCQMAYSYYDKEISEESIVKWFLLVNYRSSYQTKEKFEELNSYLYQ